MSSPCPFCYATEPGNGHLCERCGKPIRPTFIEPLSQRARRLETRKKIRNVLKKAAFVLAAMLIVAAIAGALIFATRGNQKGNQEHPASAIRSSSAVTRR